MFCDSNILVKAFWHQATEHVECQNFVFNHQLIISHQVVLEFTNVTTCSALRALSIREAQDVLDNLQQKNNIEVIWPKQQTLSTWQELTKRYKVPRSCLFDTYMVATMLSHNIHKIVTFNTKHFAQFKEIEVLTPQMVA